MAYRYECEHKGKTGSGPFHAKGNGKPRALKCKYCGGGMYVERGEWGVFVYEYGRGDYRHENVVKTFATYEKADAFVYANADKNYCVRWVFETAESCKPGQRTTI